VGSQPALDRCLDPELAPMNCEFAAFIALEQKAANGQNKSVFAKRSRIF
jgi:hypothetical protein